MSEQSKEARTSDSQFPATWYELERYRSEIKPVTVKKVTKEFVTYYDEFWKKDQRSRRCNFFHSWEEAHRALITRLELRVRGAEAEWQRSKESLSKARQMRAAQ